MKIKILFALFLWFAAQMLPAQLIFVQKEHDFGQVLAYTQSHFTLQIKNKGKKAEAIQKIIPSTSALQVAFPSQPIKPGQTVEAEVYMENHLVGHFDKTLSLTTATGENLDVMHIKGNIVLQAMAQQNADTYPVKIGNISLSSDNLEFDEVPGGQQVKQTLMLYNGGSDIYKPELMHLPTYLSAEAIPTMLHPGHEGKIIVTLNSTALPGMGLTQSTVYLSRYMGDNVCPDNELAVSAVMVPAITQKTEAELLNAPKLALSENTLRLPALGNKKKVKGVLYLSNLGKSNLELMSVQVFHPALNVSMPQTTIPAGKAVKMNITVKREFLRSSRSHLRVLLITNDPKNQKVFIDVKLK